MRRACGVQTSLPVISMNVHFIFSHAKDLSYGEMSNSTSKRSQEQSAEAEARMCVLVSLKLPFLFSELQGTIALKVYFIPGMNTGRALGMTLRISFPVLKTKRSEKNDQAQRLQVNQSKAPLRRNQESSQVAILHRRILEPILRPLSLQIAILMKCPIYFRASSAIRK